MKLKLVIIIMKKIKSINKIKQIINNNKNIKIQVQDILQ